MIKTTKLPPQFDSSCKLTLTRDARKALRKGALKISIKRTGGKESIRNFNLKVNATRGKFDIKVGGDNSQISIGEGCRGTWSIRLWRDAVVDIGRGTSCNSAHLYCDNSDIMIGEDCMLSDEIVLQSGDQHGIVDILSGKISNNKRASILVGNHVWIGRRVNILHGSQIGDGSIIGLGALVKSEIPKNSLAVGFPAKAIRHNVTWSRSVNSLDAYSNDQTTKYIESRQ